MPKADSCVGRFGYFVFGVLNLAKIARPILLPSSMAKLVAKHLYVGHPKLIEAVSLELTQPPDDGGQPGAILNCRRYSVPPGVAK
jgi:hypothetical protein